MPTADRSDPFTQGRVTAAVLIIGDEILSGRTQDTNLRDIARYLAAHGVDLVEARTVADVQAEIVAAQCLDGRILPVDVAALAMFLASDDARYCTGHDYFIDAGWR